MDDEEQLRRVMEESLRTARADDVRRAQEASAPTAPMLPQAGHGAGIAAEGMSDFQRQRQEAIKRQAARWHQLHGHEEQQPSSLQQQTVNNEHHRTPLYPSLPGNSVPSEVASRAPLYPSIPRDSDDSPAGVFEDRMNAFGEAENQYSQQSLNPALNDPYLEELQRRKRQEEEDHRLAQQLAEAYAAEDSSEDPDFHEAHEHLASTRTAQQYEPALNDDSDWQEVHRTISMQQHASEAAGTAAPGSNPSSARPSSQAAAAAGSTAGSLLGAGLSALLAMAANAAAARSAQHSDESSAHATATATSSGGQHQHAAGNTRGNRQQHSTNGNDPAAGTSSSSSGVQGMLGTAANALWNYIRGRNSSSSGSAHASSTSSSHQQQHGSEDRDMQTLQQIMRQLMMEGPQGQQQAHASSSTSTRGTGQGGGFRVVSLPGGGFAATYSSSSSSSGRPQQQQQGYVDDDPFAGFMGPGQDIMTQLLLAGARSARSNHYRQQQQQDPLGFPPMGPGFQTFDPDTGFSRFEPRGGMFMPGFPGFPGGGSDQGLESLIQMLLGGREGGGLNYEDLVNLDNVHVSTPDDVLAQLPRSKYVEGRQPGDSDTCVICQQQFAPGDSLLHLPCLHAFHEDCVTPWLERHSKKCPVCKTDVC